MARNTRPRKAYRPRPVHSNALQVAITGAAKLPRADVVRQMAVARQALAEFSAGRHCPTHWRSLADTANMAESLALLGIGSGPNAQDVITQAQAVLAHVATRHAQRGSWTLYAAELDTLQWLLTLHHVQLGECTYTEFERAFADTRNRVAQARAGNPPAGAIVIEGEIA